MQHQTYHNEQHSEKCRIRKQDPGNILFDLIHQLLQFPFSEQIHMDHAPDILRREFRSGLGRVSPILVVHLKIRPALPVSPPDFSDRRKKGSRLFRDPTVGIRHSLLFFRLIFFCPGHVDHRRASGFFDPLRQRPRCFEKLLLRSEGMCMLLQDHIVVVAIADIEPHVRLLHMLCQKPSAVRDHCYLAVISVFFNKLAPHHHRQVIVNSMC